MPRNDHIPVNLVIEKGVPMPKPTRGRWAHFLPMLAVGDSFYTERRGDMSASREWASKNGIRVTSRQMMKKGVKGWRIWRIA